MRSPDSYEREIRSLESRLSEECANGLRLARENESLRATLDDLALREHLAANPTPPSGLKTETLGSLSPPRTTVFRKPDGSPLIEITFQHTFSKLTRLRKKSS